MKLVSSLLDLAADEAVSACRHEAHARREARRGFPEMAAAWRKYARSCRRTAQQLRAIATQTNS